MRRSVRILTSLVVGAPADMDKGAYKTWYNISPNFIN